MSNQDWQNNFIKRCEGVDWRVELSASNHYKVYSAERGFLFSFSKTPGDKRAMLNAVSAAKKHGIEQLETQVKLQRERERLVRIEKDRETNGFVVSDVTTEADLKPAAAVEQPNLGFVNGVQIIAIAPAKIKTPVMTEPRPLADAEELMLADESVVYRCRKPAATTNHPELEGICERTFPVVGSLQAHITYHSRKTMPSVTIANQTRLARASSKEIPEVPTTKTKAEKVTNANSPTELGKRIDAALDAVGLLAAAATSIKAELTDLKTDLDKIQIADPATVQKAAQFDNLKAMLS